jgi:hypothetical protein
MHLPNKEWTSEPTRQRLSIGFAGISLTFNVESYYFNDAKCGYLDVVSFSIVAVLNEVKKLLFACQNQSHTNKRAAQLSTVRR